MLSDLTPIGELNAAMRLSGAREGHFPGETTQGPPGVAPIREANGNVTRYLVGGVIVRVRAHPRCFGGLARGISAFKWEGRVLLLGPLARLKGRRASGTIRCLYAPHFRDFQPPRQSRSALPSVTPPWPHRYLAVVPLIGY